MSNWNPLVAQPGIVDRLEATTRSGPNAWCRKISTRKELAAVAEESQVVPGLFVVYDTFQVLAADEFESTLLHRWFVTLSLKNAASQKESAPLDMEAGPLLAAVMDALVGYEPPGCATPLILSTPPRPYYSPSNFAYYPLAFTHESYHCYGG